MIFNFKKTVGAIASVSLATVLFAPPLKTRLGLTDLYTYYLPASLFAFIALCLIVLQGTGINQRLKSSTLYLLLITPLLYAFMLGGGTETGLLLKVLLNFGLAFVVLLFPWDEKYVHYFLVTCAALV